jgi:hypothetical protein
MQNEEKSKLEERIIQYFDGSLNREESRSLLADVAKSAESRALFKGHESLQRLITAARVPMEMPLEAKRSIADRIPGLLAFIPGLLGGAEAIPVITQSANPFIAFLSKIPLSTAISVGTSAVVLTTAGVIVKNKLEDNAASNHKAKTAVVQNQVAQPNAQVYAVLPNRDLAVPDIGRAPAAFAAKEATGTPGSSHWLALQGTERTKGTNTTSNSLEDAANASATNMANKPVADAANTPSPNAAAVANNIPANTPAPASQPAPVPPAAPPINLTASPRPVPGVVADIPRGQYGILRQMPELFGDDAGVKPFFAIGERVHLGSADNVGSISSDGYSAAFDFRAGFDIPTTDALSVRIQGGYSQFAHEIERLGTLASQVGGLQNFGTYSTVNLDAAFWSTIGMAYQFYASDAVPLTFSAGIGAAWLHPIAPMFDLGLSTVLPISSAFAIRPGINFQAAWTTQDGIRGETSAPASAILVDQQFSNKNLLSTSLGVNIGFIFHY